MKTFLSSLLIVFVTIFVAPAYADDACKNLYGGPYYRINVTSSKAHHPVEIQGDTWTADGVQRGIAKIIPVQGNTNYTFSVSGIVGAQYLVITEYASIEDMPSSAEALATVSSSTGQQVMKVTTKANTRYILAGVWGYPTPAAGTVISMTEPQLEKGSTATAYQPYNPLCATCDGTVVVENGESRCIPSIKIATNAYNAARFSPVVTDLNSTIATIRDVVTNTINQTAAIADLQATKQTRPDAECPKFRQCLLVEDNNNIPHWYLIKDPVRDLVKSLRDNKINSAGETTTTAYAANGYDGTNGTVDSRYYKGYVAMRELADGSTSVNNRQFGASLTGGDNGGQYKTLGDQEWAVTWDGNETGTANSFLPGVIYGTSRCSKVKPSSTTVGTEGWNTIENSDPVNDAANIQSYAQCYCKMTGVGVDGEFTPVRDSSRAPWVFRTTNGSAASCANLCAYYCAGYVRDDASFRQRIMDWAVE